MNRKLGGRIRRTRNGFTLRLPGAERALLTQLAGELTALLDALAPGDPTPEDIRRLFPAAHALDGGHDSESFRETLLEQRRDALEVLAGAASADRLTDDEADRWLEAINSLRLTIGTQLGVTEEPADVNESDPNYAEWICYQYLSFLESELIEAMSGALPSPIPGAGDDLPEDPWGEPLGGLRWDGTPFPDPPTA
jgi:hypothetical protein